MTRRALPKPFEREPSFQPGRTTAGTKTLAMLHCKIQDVLADSQQRPPGVTQPGRWRKRAATEAGGPEWGQQTRQQSWPGWTSGPGPPSALPPRIGLPYAALPPVGAGFWLGFPPALVPKCPLPNSNPLPLSWLKTSHPNPLPPFLVSNSHASSAKLSTLLYFSRWTLLAHKIIHGKVLSILLFPILFYSPDSFQIWNSWQETVGSLRVFHSYLVK